MAPRGPGKRTATPQDPHHLLANKRQKPNASNKQVNGTKLAGRGSAKASNQGNFAAGSIPQNLNGFSSQDVIVIPEDAADIERSLRSAQVIPKPVCPKGADFPRYVDGDVYIELAKIKKYCYWLHEDLLSCYSWVFKQSKGEPEELNVLRSMAFKRDLEMSSRYELQYNDDLDLWVLKRAAITRRLEQSSSSIQDSQSERVPSRIDSASQSSHSPPLANASVPSLRAVAAGPSNSSNGYQLTGPPEADVVHNNSMAQVLSEEREYIRLSDHPVGIAEGIQAPLRDGAHDVQRQTSMLVTCDDIKQEKDVDIKQENNIDLKQGIDTEKDSSNSAQLSTTTKPDVATQSHINLVSEDQVNSSMESVPSTITDKEKAITLSQVESQQPAALHHKLVDPAEYYESAVSEEGFPNNSGLVIASQSQLAVEDATRAQAADLTNTRPPTYVLEAYNSLFLMFYDQDPGLTRTSPVVALSQIEPITRLAEYYGCMSSVRSRLSEILAVFGHQLFKAVSDDPYPWLKISVSLRDTWMFTEAMIHYVGKNFNATQRIFKNVKLPEKVISLLKFKIECLKTANDTFVMKMFLSTICVDDERKLLCHQGQEHRDTGIIVALWSEWFRNALHVCTVTGTGYADLYRIISTGGQAYLDNQEVKKSYETLTGVVPSEEQEDKMSGDMALMKKHAQTEVKALVDHLAMVDQSSTTWLTCTRIDANELPWL